MKTINSFIKSYLSCSKLHDDDHKLISADQASYEFHLIRRYLITHLKSDSLVAICLEKDYRYVLTMLACMDVGITYIPLKPDYPLERIEQIKQASLFNLLLDVHLVDKIFNQGGNDVQLDSFHKSENAPLYIVFTSGSTGLPKGVIIQRKAYTNFLNWVADYFSDIGRSDRILNTADFTFDLSMLDIAILITCNPNFFISKFNNNIFKLASEIEGLGITTMATVPNNITLLLNSNISSRVDYSSLKRLLLGGARFSYGLYATLQKDLGYVDIFNLYGPTEATVYCTVKKLTFDSDVVDKVVSVGRDISNCHTIILDHNMQELPAIIKGEVYIGGVQLMHSYINDVDKTSEVLIEIGSKLYYKTGDIGFKDQVDDLYITGRMDDTIKVSGYRVNLSDIDSYISSIPLVDECATIAIFDEIKENILVAYIASKVKDKDSIYNELRKIMPQYQLPQEIVFIDDFPLNNSGKISKNQLIELHKENLHKVKTK